MKAKVILNPYAGRWLARQRWAEAEAALKAAKVDFEFEQTNGPGHGISLASEAVHKGYNPIISAGGDGSISEVINGILQASEPGNTPNFGVIPLGTANDLVDNLKMPKDLNAAAQVIAAGNVRFMDICQVNGRYFDNNAAIGLEPYITLIQQRITRLKGTMRYVVAALLGIKDNPQWTMHLTWEEGSYDGPVTLVTVGNSPRTGGVFFMTPHADPFDGKLTFVHAFMPTRSAILRLLPRTMKPLKGSYVEHPAVHEISTTWLRVQAEQPTPAHADGEIFSTGIMNLEYSVIPERLPILLP
jgi:diacylglycerol kinase (ATP)